MHSVCILLLLLFCGVHAAAQPSLRSWNDQPGGKYLPSAGTVRALLVFAEFPDDSLHPDHAEWPRGMPPRRMGQWIDSAWSGTPTPGSLTEYFRDMSFGAFRFIGTTRHVVAPHTRASYRARNATRRTIHHDLIAQLDSSTDFADFDRWTLVDEYRHEERPDSIIDLMIIIWRNIGDDITDPAHNMRSAFGFIGDQADLGFGQAIAVDEGRRYIHMSFGVNHRRNSTTGPAGSGITMSKPYLYTPFNLLLRTAVHEIGHYLMGGMEYHTGFACWGMVSTHGSRMFVPNSFERHRLGWITLRTITADTATLHDLRLPDYVTTGVAVRYVIDSTTGQYFYLENHQGISHWDRTMHADTIERGLYVLRQDLALDSASGPGHQLRLIPADGRHRWTVPRMEYNQCCGSILLPVFRQLEPDRHHGAHDCDHVPFTEPSTGKARVSEIILIENDSGATAHVNRAQGNGRDAFRPGYRTLFSPWSNPTSQDKHRRPTGFGFAITGVDSSSHGDVYRLSLFSHTAQFAPPAAVEPLGATRTGRRTVLSWQPNEEPDIRSYRIYRIGSNNAATLLATVRHTRAEILRWTDRNARRGTVYAIAAVDSQGQESTHALLAAP